jgi:uncharacterized protein (TIGR02145 family)
MQSCQKDPTIPKVSTGVVSEVTRTEATAGGEVTGDGGATVSARGVCWHTGQNPTTDNMKTVDGSGTGLFSSALTGLVPGTTYYLRAYAINEAGVAYGEQRSFSTGAIVPPVVITSAVEQITSDAAMSGGNITDDGGADVTERGVCWSREAGPTLDDFNTSEGGGTGGFTSSLTGLESDTKYYVRAYATNSAGTAYGNEISFDTEPVKDADGNAYTTIKLGDQVWLTENLMSTSFTVSSGAKADNSIPVVTGGSEWSNMTTPACCWYENDMDSYRSYGLLYNWYAVNAGNICPDGYHVATKSDWDNLLQYLIDNGFNYNGSTTTTISENQLAKSLASVTGWDASAATGAPGNSDYPDVRNSTGFNALPSGYRHLDGGFYGMGQSASFWTSTSYSDSYAHYYHILSYWPEVDYYEWDKKLGYSVRCVKD